MTTPPVVLTVAGTDSGGAAGIAADLATIGHHGCHGACVVTAITAQDTTGVRAVHPVPIEVVDAQLSAVLDDLPVAVVKTGMLGTPAVVDLVVHRLGQLPLVVDPVLVATSGAVLGDSTVAVAHRRLAQVAAVITPNLDEARALTGRAGTPADLAARLADLGCAVVLTGGDAGIDWLALPGGKPHPLAHPPVETANDHGTGCTFASALAAVLAATRGPNPTRHHAPTPADLTAEALVSACRAAAAYVTHQLTTSASWDLGRGRGPIAHTAHTHLGGTT